MDPADSRVRIGPIGRWFYPHALDAVYGMALLGIAPYLIATRRAGHSYRHVIRRRGNVNVPDPDHSRSSAGNGARPRLWIHGVSVGEVLSVRALVREIAEAYPEWEVVFSSTSLGGLGALRRTYPDNIAFEYPFDFSGAVSRTFRRVRPDLILIIEHELWPNFLHRACLDDVPVVVVNAQVSDRSLRGYRLLSRFIRWPPPAIVRYCAQNAETLERLIRLGVPREKVTVTGNLKYDNPCKETRDLRAELGISPASWILVGASTHDGEEEILLEAFRRLKSKDPAARLILIPRKTERVGSLTRMIEMQGFKVHLRSRTNGSSSGNGRDSSVNGRDGVILVDTMGELPAFCKTGNVVFVGGTMVPFGGHNVIEPASLGKPVLIGPHSHNFRTVVNDFLGLDAITVAEDQDALHSAIERLHRDAEVARAMGARALDAVLKGGGASRRTMEALAPILDGVGVRKRTALEALQA
jgi:3-deoxy-D-manno-octulosonic-acid transferase